jgi:hypothetical protein
MSRIRTDHGPDSAAASRGRVVSSSTRSRDAFGQGRRRPSKRKEEDALVNSQSHDLAVGLPDLSMAAAPVYANVAHTTFTPYDFRVTFSLLTVPHDQPSGSLASIAALALQPRAVAQVVLPAGAVVSLVDLLRAEFDRYVEQFGPPRPTVARSAAAASTSGSA